MSTEVAALQELEIAVGAAEANRFAPYRKTNEADDQFDETIPAHWDRKQVGHLCEMIVGFAFSSEGMLREPNGIPLIRGDNITEGWLRFGDRSRWWPEVTPRIERYLLADDDIVIGMDGSKVGKNFAMVKESDLPLLLVQRVTRLRSNPDVDARYLCYSIGSEGFRAHVDVTKTDPAIPHITAKDIASFPVYLPPLSEQRTIASFLDARTSKIDTLVKKKESLIGLLQEKRTALISHAVTKGLNPAAPLKDSGVDWLGQIPAHWQQLQLGQMLRLQRGHDLPEQLRVEGGYPIVTSSGPSATHHEPRVKGPGVVTGRYGTIGKVFYIEEDYWPLNTTLYVVDFKENDPEFCRFVLLNAPLDIDADKSAVPGVNRNVLHRLDVACPPFEEQRDIVQFLKSRFEKLDALIAKVTLVIERLREYRTALISAAVTGKIDVREKF